jgi:polyhydroxybutyrate depolymerase
MILAFHGYGSDAATFSTLTGYPDQAAAAGFVMVVPDGAGRTWQFDGHGSDAQFVDALIDDVARSFCIDQRRIAASGFSAGAAFTIAYACAHLDRIAAIATVAVNFLIGCTTPLSILAFHGTADPMVPYQDGAEGLSLPDVKVRGTELTMTDWATLDGCETDPVLDHIGTEVVRHTYPGCQDGTEVVLYEIQGGGHSWPGADPGASGGLTTQQVDATKEAVAFFGRHARP